MDDLLHGHCDPMFAPLRAHFARSFTAEPPRREIGAALCVYLDGRPVVDLWGGFADPQGRANWKSDTLVDMYSVGKGLAALCVHRLAGEGRIDLERPVAAYWPEFGAAGKDKIRVRHILDHRAGIPYLPESVTGLDFDLERVSAAIASAPPVWPPEARPCYHSLVMGFVVAQLILRVTGSRIDDYLRDEIVGPLGAAVYFRLRGSELARQARLIESEPGARVRFRAQEPESIMARTFHPFTRAPEGDDAAATERAWACHGEARGLARIYAALAMGGTLHGVRIVDTQAMALARAPQWEGFEALTNSDGWRMALGFLLNCKRFRVGPNPRAFGHDGAGGALGFADPDRRIGWGYAPNYLSLSLLDNPRCEALIETLYECLTPEQR